MFADIDRCRRLCSIVCIFGGAHSGYNLLDDGNRASGLKGVLIENVSGGRLTGFYDSPSAKSKHAVALLESALQSVLPRKAQLDTERVSVVVVWVAGGAEVRRGCRHFV